MTASSARASGFDFEDQGPALLSTSERFHVRSKEYAEPFRIEVALPAARVAGDKLPVIYVLDGNWSFPVVAQVARALTIGPGAIPPAIIVGIGYAIDGPMAFGKTAAMRYRDLAPSEDAGHVAAMRQALPAALWPADMPVGTSAKFHRLLETEVKSFIEARYPVDTGNQTLLGVSLGGLFALRTLFSSPRSFHRYIAISPSIWWNDCEVLDLEASAALAGGINARLFLGVGEEEEAQAPEARMVSNMVEMSNRLKSWPGLRLTSHVFPGEGHMSVPPAAIGRGLRAVFAA